MPKPLQSERLVLRPLHIDDYAFIRSVQGNAEVMRYIGSGIPRTEEQTQIAMTRYLELEKENPLLGVWVVELRTGEKIGNFLLRKPATQEPVEGLEIGYSFLPEFWDKGYASEAAGEVITYARREFESIRIVALIEPSNEASRKVLTKLGFKTHSIVQYVDPSNGRVSQSELLDFT